MEKPLTPYEMQNIKLSAKEFESLHIPLVKTDDKVNDDTSSQYSEFILDKDESSKLLEAVQEFEAELAMKTKIYESREQTMAKDQNAI